MDQSDLKKEHEQEAPGIQAEMRNTPDCGETSYVGHDRLKDKIALVTGGDSGIGRAVAIAFAREGADVAIAHLDAEQADADETRRYIDEAGRKSLGVALDLAVDENCKRLVDITVERFGHIDVLVNNAAYQGEALDRFEDLSAERIEHTFRANIVSMFNLVRHALAHMRKGSAIINVASIQGYQPSPHIIDYATTKGAIITFTKGLSQELIERGIRVNCVAPGPVWTPLVVQSYDKEKIAAHGERSPIGRTAQPVELAPSFVFLASEDGRYVVGEILGVTGGMLLS
jgi:NAD(P)-dependent dehydrogenase (short-subunit alcohol dehydrogenase family)